MPPEKTASLIIIGNEILSGRTRDANLAFIGGRCDEIGIPLKEVRVIPDVETEIVNNVNELRARFDYVFTTGGIGPTHDDITSASVAKAFGVVLERNAEAVAALQEYYADASKLNEARLKMADIPREALLIENPLSGAPGFQLENVFVLPGVPLIMQAMFDGMRPRLTGGRPVHSESIQTDLTEGAVAAGLDTIQNNHPDVGIGSYPFFRKGTVGVNLVIRSVDKSSIMKARADILALIQDLKGRVVE
ncbi:MAG: molybdopterin-binding protein [Gammaproteobacteria bacterium]